MCQCGGSCSSGCTTLKGDTGTPGSKWYDGAGAPAPNLGIVGDFYLNLTNGDVYEKTATATWTLDGNIKGATGATGAAGTSVLYDDWTPVSLTGGAVYTQLKTTGSAITLANNGDSLIVKAGFTLTKVGFTQAIQLLIGSVNVSGGVSFLLFGTVETFLIETEITRISDVLMRYTTVWTQYGVNGVSTLSTSYFTPANVAITSLSTGNIISTTVNNLGIAQSATCNYLRVLRNEI